MRVLNSGACTRIKKNAFDLPVYSQHWAPILVINMMYKDSKNAKIIQKFQLEGGALVSKVKWPGFTISRYVVKLQRLGGKIFEIWIFTIVLTYTIIFWGRRVKFFSLGFYYIIWDTLSY